MASVGALGIGLSVVFSVFLVLLLAELYYLLFWKRRSLLASSRVNSVAPERGGIAGNGVPGGDSTAEGFVAKIIVGADGECVLAPPRLLFTIKEETREDLVESEDAKLRKKKSVVAAAAAAPASEHVVVQVLSSLSPPPDNGFRRSSHDDASSSSSSSVSTTSSSPSFKPIAAAAAAAAEKRSSTSSSSSVRDEEEDLDRRSWASAQGTATEDDSFVTPPSSPCFSSPASSPMPSQLRISHRRQVRSIQMPPLPPLPPKTSSDDRYRRSSSKASCSSSSIADSPPLSPVLIPMPSPAPDEADEGQLLLERSIELASPSPSASLASESWRR